MAKELVLVFLILILGTPLTVPQASGLEDLTLNIAGEAPTFNAQGQPVLVAGVWHQVVVRLSSPILDTLIVRASLPGAPSQDMGSYYLWERRQADDTWSDKLYSTFIRAELSSAQGREIIFHIGVDAAALPGAWRVEVLRDGGLVGERTVEVRTPQVSYGLSSADFSLQVEPFKDSTAISGESQYLRVSNQGNVPLRLQVAFSRLHDRLALLNPQEVVHPGTDVRYFLRLNLDPRAPQVMEVRGTSRLEVPNAIPSPGASRLIPSFEGDFRIRVIVGRSGYIVNTMGGVVFQSLETLATQPGAILTWQVFLTGDEGVALDVTAKGVDLVGVLQGNTALTLPATLYPTPDAELPITLQVRATTPSVDAEVVYSLRLLGSGEVRTYRTAIRVGPRVPSGLPPSSYLWLAASFLSALVVGIVAHNWWRSGGLWMRPWGGGEKPKEAPEGRLMRRRNRGVERGPTKGRRRRDR